LQQTQQIELTGDDWTPAERGAMASLQERYEALAAPTVPG
jgi:hypothetical protein